jgi:hypothetical protein
VRRPRSVTLVGIILFALAAFNGLGAVTAGQRLEALAREPLSVPPVYLLASRAVWALVFVGLAAGLWRLKAWARLGALAAYPLYLAQGWLERLAFARADYVRATLPWDALVDAAGLLVILVVLTRQRAAGLWS